MLVRVDPPRPQRSHPRATAGERPDRTDLVERGLLGDLTRRRVDQPRQVRRAAAPDDRGVGVHHPRPDRRQLAGGERAAHDRVDLPQRTARQHDRRVDRVARKVAYKVAEKERTFVSPQELVRMVDELLAIAESTEDCARILSGWAAKTSEGAAAVKTTGLLPALWSEVCQARLRIGT